MEYTDELRNKLKFLEEIVDSDIIESIYSAIEDIDFEFENKQEELEEVLNDLKIYKRALIKSCDNIASGSCLWQRQDKLTRNQMYFAYLDMAVEELNNEN